MGLQKKLLSGLFWVLLLNLMIKPLWILGVERGVQNAVGAEMYGLYITLFNLSYIFNILLDLGVTNFTTRNIAQHPKLIQKHLSGILSLKLVLLGLYLLVTFSVGLLRGYSSHEFVLLAWLCFNQFLNSLILYIRSNFEGLLLFKWDSVLSILDRLLMILICGGLLLKSPQFKIEWFVWAQTIAYLVTALTALMVLVRKVGMKRLSWKPAFSAAVLRQSLPFALLVLLMASYNRIDPVLLEWILPDGKFQAGIYGGAFRLLDALTMIAYLVSVPLLPIFAKLTAKEGNHDEIAQTTQMMFSLIMVFAIAAAITFAFLSFPLMQLMYHQNQVEYQSVFKPIIFGIIPISFTYIFGTLLTANGNLKHLNILALVSLLINVAVNLVLIPRLGAVGSAWASLSAQSFMAITQMLLAIKIFEFKPKILLFIQLLLYIIVIIVANQWCVTSQMNVWMHLVILVVVALASGCALRLVQVKKIITAIQEK